MSQNSSSRIVVIDALRGFALGGVALVHMVEQYAAGPVPDYITESITPSILDQIIQGFIGIFIMGKFFALFSILFGLSFFIQMDSAAKKGKNFTTTFLWRAFILFIIGYIHQLFYRGDILTIYAVLAPFLIPFYYCKPKTILIASVFFLVSVPRLLVAFFWGSQPLLIPHSLLETDHQLVNNYYQAIQSGTMWDVFTQNAIYGMLFKMDVQIVFSGRLYLTLGYFLLGLWLGKIGLFRDLTYYRKPVKKTLFWALGGLVLAVAITAILFVTSPQPIDFQHWQHRIALNTSDWANLSLTLILLCGFILIYLSKNGHRILSFFAPYGRMALTNYILQSILGTYLLFGWGLGYFGKFGPSFLFSIAVLLILCQSIVSREWLKYFKYGPLEWLWRSATYLKWQPLRK